MRANSALSLGVGDGDGGGGGGGGRRGIKQRSWVHLVKELMRISAVACAAFNYHHHQTDFSMKSKSILRTCRR